MQRLIIHSIFIFFLFLVIGASADGQQLNVVPPDVDDIAFDSNGLKTLYEQLYSNEPQAIGDTLVDMIDGIVFQRRLELEIHGHKIPVIIETNQQLAIIHIGVEIFQRFKRFFHVYPYCAVERLMLELLLNYDQAEQILKSDGVSISLDGEPFGSLGFDRIEQVLSVMLVVNKYQNTWQDYRYILKCKHDGHLLQWVLPAREELIKGYDKRELDQRLIRYVLDNYSVAHKDDWRNELHQLENGLWVKTGYDFFQGISTRRYYVINDYQREPVFSEKYPDESILTYLQEPGLSAPVVLLNLRYKTVPDTTINIEYSRILHALEIQHTVYAGIEEIVDSVYRLVVVFENNNFAHIHLMSLTLPLTLFKSDTLTVHADFYPNIRRDNVKDIFSTENVDKKEQLFQIKLK